MELKHLKIIKQVFDQLQNGTSNPITINSAYLLLPNHVEGSPMRAKIMAINRFGMLNYADELKTAIDSDKQVEVIPVIPENASNSIGTIENKSTQSHSESSSEDDEIKVNREFLTANEKDELKSPESGTKLKVDGRSTRWNKQKS